MVKLLYRQVSQTERKKISISSAKIAIPYEEQSKKTTEVNGCTFSAKKAT